MPKHQTLGSRLAQARREMGVRLRRDISQLDVAKAVGVSGASVSEWEADKKAPREEALGKLSVFLGVTPAYLRYGVAEPIMDARKLTDEELARAVAITERAEAPRKKAKKIQKPRRQA